MSAPAAAPVADVRLKREPTDPVLEFSWFPKMGYRRRVVLAALCALVGLGLQVITLSPWWGLPFLFAALVLSWVVGLDNNVDRRRMRHDVAWETVPFDRVTMIRVLDRKVKKWDRSLVDISSAGGCVLFLGLAAALALGSVFLAEAAGTEIGIIVGVDGALLVLAQWFSGIRSQFRQPDLMVKVDHVLEVLHEVGGVGKGRELQAQLEMQGKGDARMPTDLKISVNFADPPEGFLGVQAQVVLNRVQGKPYPYFYAVVLARKGHGLFKKTKSVRIPEGITRETRTKDDVDIVILRQHTTKTSGYHTKKKKSARIFRLALETAATYLGRPRIGPELQDVAG